MLAADEESSLLFDARVHMWAANGGKVSLARRVLLTQLRKRWHLFLFSRKL